MRSINKTILCFVCHITLLISINLSAQNRILVDGFFDDWDDKPEIYTDQNGDGGDSDIDFGTLKVYNDDDFFFFYLEVGIEINLQSDFDVTLYIDGDNNTSTGEAVNGIGAELKYNLGAREGEIFLTGSTFDIGHNDVGILNAPTVTSNVFEIAVRRNLSFFEVPLFSSNQISIAFLDGVNGDELPSNNDLVNYTVSSDEQDALPSYSISKSADIDLRILSYNVLFNSIFDSEKEPAYTRILNAIQPDIIGFQEIYDFNSAQVAAQVESMIPAENGEEWHHAQAGSSDNHVISKHPIIEDYIIEGSGSSVNGAFLIDISNIDEPLLFIVAHTPCCGNNEGRQIEIDAIMAFVRDAKAGVGPLSLPINSPIIIIGDMNLVGYKQQLETLLTGDIINSEDFGSDFMPDWDGSDFVDARPYTSNLPMNFTWYDEGSSFSPGRLDFNVFSGSVLSLENSFSLFTPALPEDSLATNTLLVTDVVVASDHLPQVCDFKLLIADDISESLIDDFEINVFPNPSTCQFNVDFELKNRTVVNIEILDLSGKLIQKIIHQELDAGSQLIPFNLKSISNENYLLNITINGTSITHNLILIKP
ncbi:MAG: exonuclease III [Urechidicola sp.]|jgi:exonuclease III